MSRQREGAAGGDRVLRATRTATERRLASDFHEWTVDHLMRRVKKAECRETRTQTWGVASGKGAGIKSEQSAHYPISCETNLNPSAS